MVCGLRLGIMGSGVVVSLVFVARPEPSGLGFRRDKWALPAQSSARIRVVRIWSGRALPDGLGTPKTGVLPKIRAGNTNRQTPSFEARFRATPASDSGSGHLRSGGRTVRWRWPGGRTVVRAVGRIAHHYSWRASSDHAHQGLPLAPEQHGGCRGGVLGLLWRPYCPWRARQALPFQRSREGEEAIVPCPFSVRPLVSKHLFTPMGKYARARTYMYRFERAFRSPFGSFRLAVVLDMKRLPPLAPQVRRSAAHLV